MLNQFARCETQQKERGSWGVSNLLLFHNLNTALLLFTVSAGIWRRLYLGVEWMLIFTSLFCSTVTTVDGSSLCRLISLQPRCRYRVTAAPLPRRWIIYTLLFFVNLLPDWDRSDRSKGHINRQHWSLKLSVMKQNQTHPSSFLLSFCHYSRLILFSPPLVACWPLNPSIIHLYFLSAV